jgi:hypothetical protein
MPLRYLPGTIVAWAFVIGSMIIMLKLFLALALFIF